MGDEVDPAFDRDKFLLRQQLLAMTGEKYYVWDEQGQVLLFLERPYHTLRQLAAFFAGLLAAGVVFGLCLAVDRLALAGLKLEGVGIGVGFLGAIVTLIVVAVALQAKRNLTIYRDDTKREPLLEILQDQKVTLWSATYTVKTAAGEVLGTLEKVYFYNLFRKRWYFYTPDGLLHFTAFEDSLAKALLRRFLGPMLGLLRTNFIYARGEDDLDVLGAFNRTFTLLDRYVLDLTMDSERWLDRRLAVCMGVMLDTGERR